MLLSVGRKPDGSLKDTRRNILERHQFVVHIASAAMAEAVTQSSASFESGVSEVAALGLELTPFVDFSVPRLAACSIAYACELYEEHAIAGMKQTLLIGRIRHIYIADELVEEDEKGRTQISALKVQPLARLGGDNYWVNGDVLSIKRPR